MPCLMVFEAKLPRFLDLIPRDSLTKLTRLSSFSQTKLLNFNINTNGTGNTITYTWVCHSCLLPRGERDVLLINCKKNKKRKKSNSQRETN